MGKSIGALTTLSLLSLLSSPSLLAEDLGIQKHTNDSLILSSKSCEQLLAQEKAICAWRMKSEPAFKIPPYVGQSNLNRCKKGKNKSFSLTIKECLPEVAKKYHKKKLAHCGPNCWGTAMSFNGLTPKPRFMWPEELTYWMESPLCRKLVKDEALLPGDVINVFGPEFLSPAEGDEDDEGTRFWKALYPGRYAPLTLKAHTYTGYHRLLHSVTFLTQDLAFGKDSPAHDDPFYFHPMKEVYARPRSSDAKCQENQDLTPHLREYKVPPKSIHRSRCDYFSLAYRCEDISHHFSKQDLSPKNQEIWKSIQSLQSIQKNLFPMVATQKPILGKSELKNITLIADSASKRALEELKTVGKDKTQEMLLTMEYFAAVGVRKTLSQLGLIRE